MPNIVSSLRQFCREIPVPVEKLLKVGMEDNSGSGVKASYI